ncbi:MAG TPA: hypothetical protein DCQ84_14000 [Candidatus Competibacteraceae bacterium]|nr:hypothetical protein [Candidatus Competibacteraceae bacterium]
MTKLPAILDAAQTALSTVLPTYRWLDGRGLSESIRPPLIALRLVSDRPPAMVGRQAQMEAAALFEIFVAVPPDSATDPDAQLAALLWRARAALLSGDPPLGGLVRHITEDPNHSGIVFQDSLYDHPESGGDIARVRQPFLLHYIDLIQE